MNLVVVAVVPMVLVMAVVLMVLVMAVSGIIIHSMGLVVRTVIEVVIIVKGGDHNNLCLEYYFMNKHLFRLNAHFFVR